MDIYELKELLSHSWSKETCAPGLKNSWSEENPSLGQCAISSLIVNDFFGGKIMRCMTSTGSHYFNIIDDELVDLTVEQFLGEVPKYDEASERTRAYLLSSPDTRKRYLELSRNLRKCIRGKKYILIGPDGVEHLSDKPGVLGGNRRLGIYGTLDCPSAKRWIEKGQYVKDRVFFESEADAIAAGYRPCSRCMNEEYKKWKHHILKYLSYDHLDMDEELAKIQECNGAEIVLEPTNKKCLFLLGMLFVNGVKIKILNEESLDLTETTKSFSMMPYVWSRMANTYFPNKNHSNVHSEMDRRVENLKRLGVTYNKIEDAPIDKKIFLICPVRNATNEQRKMFEDYVIEKQQEGFIVHAPHLHTVQTDFFGGYSICTQNAQAVASSSEVDIYYDQSSTGSVFDLGVAYALHKPLKVLNEQDIVFDEADMIDNIIKNWPYNEKELIHRLRNNQE